MRLLVADDELAIRELLRQVLRDDGWDVIEAADSYTALVAARRWQPRVVLSDLGLPGPPMDEVVRAFHNLAPPPAIIILTGHDRPAEILGSAAQIVRSIIQKPVDIFELQALVRTCRLD